VTSGGSNFDLVGTGVNWTVSAAGAANFPSIGATTAGTGAFTTLGASSTVTLSGLASGTPVSFLALNSSNQVVTSNVNVVSGSGTQNAIPKWNNSGGTTLGNSLLTDNGSNLIYNNNFTVSSAGAVTGVTTLTATASPASATAVLNVTNNSALAQDWGAEINVTGAGTINRGITFNVTSGGSNFDLVGTGVNWTVSAAGAANFPSIGATTAGTGAFTTLGANSTVTLSGLASGTPVSFLALNSSNQVVLASGGGGLSHITESFATTDPYSTTSAGEQLLATDGTATNISIALQPKGHGALEAQLADGTGTGGNVRGQNAVDWQMVRDDESYVASGNYSVIGGGEYNIASSDNATVGGGTNNQATNGSATVAGGNNNEVFGFGGTSGGGVNNEVGDNDATVSGGYSNWAIGDYSAIPGGWSMRIAGHDDFGFLSGNDGAGHYMSISANNTSVFGNTDLWLANNDNTARALYFYAPYNTQGAFPNGTKYVGFKAGAVTSSQIWTLPLADGTSGQVLTTNGSGILSWSSAGGGVLGITGSGTNGMIPIWTGDTTQGNSHLTDDGTTLRYTGSHITTATDYQIQGNTVLVTSSDNGDLLVGDQAGGGDVNSTQKNTFIGERAGGDNQDGSYNTFTGYRTGYSNTGSQNSFFGYGIATSNGGSNNTMTGYEAGSLNVSGSDNTFIGYFSGATNRSGDSITTLGYQADASDHLTNATAIGANAVVTASNTIQLGDPSVISVQTNGTLSVTPLSGGDGIDINNAGNGYDISGYNWYVDQTGRASVSRVDNSYDNNTWYIDQNGNASVNAIDDSYNNDNWSIDASGNANFDGSGTIGSGLTLTGPGSGDILDAYVNSGASSNAGALILQMDNSGNVLLNTTDYASGSTAIGTAHAGDVTIQSPLTKIGNSGESNEMVDIESSEFDDQAVKINANSDAGLTQIGSASDPNYITIECRNYVDINELGSSYTTIGNSAGIYFDGPLDLTGNNSGNNDITANNWSVDVNGNGTFGSLYSDIINTQGDPLAIEGVSNGGTAVEIEGNGGNDIVGTSNNWKVDGSGNGTFNTLTTNDSINSTGGVIQTNSITRIDNGGTFTVGGNLFVSTESDPESSNAVTVSGNTLFAEVTGSGSGTVAVTVTNAATGQMLYLYNNVTGMTLTLNGSVVAQGSVGIFIYYGGNWLRTN